MRRCAVRRRAGRRDAGAGRPPLLNRFLRARVPAPAGVRAGAGSIGARQSLRRRVNPLWAWFTGGNALTRIGVVVLFFGVAFLLRYFAEHFTVPIEARLAGVARRGRRA